MHTKSFRFHVKAVDDDQGLIQCYGSTFGNTDYGNDVCVKGCFTQTIKDLKTQAQKLGKKYLLPMLLNHNQDSVIGGWTDLQENSTGLLADGQVLLDLPAGQDAFTLIKNGLMDFSIGYTINPGGATYGADGTRQLTSLQLFEISPTGMAMNPNAMLVSAKSGAARPTLPGFARRFDLLTRIKAGDRSAQAEYRAMESRFQREVKTWRRAQHKNRPGDRTTRVYGEPPSDYEIAKSLATLKANYVRSLNGHETGGEL